MFLFEKKLLISLVFDAGLECLEVTFPETFAYSDIG